MPRIRIITPMQDSTVLHEGKVWHFHHNCDRCIHLYKPHGKHRRLNIMLPHSSYELQQYTPWDHGAFKIVSRVNPTSG